jgi:hypothetical protein
MRGCMDLLNWGWGLGWALGLGWVPPRGTSGPRKSPAAAGSSPANAVRFRSQRATPQGGWGFLHEEPLQGEHAAAGQVAVHVGPAPSSGNQGRGLAGEDGLLVVPFGGGGVPGVPKLEDD